jgi:peptidoglycan hydrolase CwlO-like protein
MCVEQSSFDRLVDTVNKMDKAIGQIQVSSNNTSKQLTKLNSRVYKLEEKTALHDNQWAGRGSNCIQLVNLKEVKKEIDVIKGHITEQKAVKREMRFWFLSVIIPIIGLAIAFLKYMA